MCECTYMLSTMDASPDSKKFAKLIAESGDWVTAIPFPCASLNGLCNNGLVPGNLVELSGVAGVGKSFLCHHIALMTLLQGSGQVIYIDSEGKFRTEILQAIMKNYGPLDMNRIHVAKAHNSDHQIALISDAHGILRNCCSPSLVIVDSVISLLRMEFMDIYERQGALHRLLSSLKSLANWGQVPVLMTNQMTTCFTNGVSVIPSGGKLLDDFCNMRIQITREDSIRIAKRGTEMAKFKITSGGVIDF